MYSLHIRNIDAVSIYQRVVSLISSAVNVDYYINDGDLLFSNLTLPDDFKIYNYLLKSKIIEHILLSLKKSEDKEILNRLSDYTLLHKIFETLDNLLNERFNNNFKDSLFIALVDQTRDAYKSSLSTLNYKHHLEVDKKFDEYLESKAG